MNVNLSFCASIKQGSSESPVFLKGGSEVIENHKPGVEDIEKNNGDSIGLPIFQQFENFIKNKSALNKGQIQ